MDNKEFEIEVEFTFKGKVKVYAETKYRAKEMVERHFGMTTSSGIHTSAGTDEIFQEGISDWEFHCHPDKTIKSIEYVK